MTIAPLAAAVPTGVGTVPAGQSGAGVVFAGLMGAPAPATAAGGQSGSASALPTSPESPVLPGTAYAETGVLDLVVDPSAEGLTDQTEAQGEDCAGAATDPEAGVVPAEQPASTPAAGPSAAQIMAAAQLLPVSHLLANAPAVAVPTSAPAPAQAMDATGTDAPATSVGTVTETSTAALELPVPDTSSDPQSQNRGGTDQSGGTAPAESTATQPVSTAQQNTGAEPAQAQSVGTTAPVQGTGRAEAAASADPSGVTGQVFPEVTRLVSRGDGTQRITMKLSPEALGDVRVVLTVRNGEMHVRMAGSDPAQRALLAGAGELHRLLDLAGATTSQIVVGESPASTAGQQSSAGQHGRHDTARDLLDSQDGMQHGAGQGHQDHRTAGTRDGDTSARDGAQRGVQPHPPTDPAAPRGGSTRTRTAGVDVSM